MTDRKRMEQRTDGTCPLNVDFLSERENVGLSAIRVEGGRKI